MMEELRSGSTLSVSQASWDRIGNDNLLNNGPYTQWSITEIICDSAQKEYHTALNSIV